MKEVVQVNMRDLVPKIMVAHLLHETIKSYLGEKGTFVAEILTVRRLVHTYILN